VSSGVSMGIPVDGRAELMQLARYATMPSDQILRDDLEMWAVARLVDGVANIFHGYKSPLSQLVRTVTTFQEKKGVVAWPDLSRHYRDDDAGFLLGVYGFSENYCDTGLRSVAHPGSIVIPALIVASQLRQISGREALAAIAVGYNICEYLGAILNGGYPRMAHQIRGFRPTPSVGPIAAAGMFARINGASEDGCLQAMALACQQGGGLRAGAYQSSLAATRIQSGEAIRRALHSVHLAAAGILSDPAILRADGGYLGAYAGGELGNAPLPPLIENDALATVSMKLDCTPHTLVTMLDLARELSERENIDVNNINSVVVSVPEQHNTISSASAELPTTFTVAARHVPFCIALALISKSHLYPSTIISGIANPDVIRLTPHISLVPDEELTKIFNSDSTSWPARIEIEWKSGRREKIERHAPATSDWNAETASRFAKHKMNALLSERLGTAEPSAVSYFDRASCWPNFWSSLRDMPLSPSLAPQL
jgi:2-methylcitrate dehydratase PrpD